MAGYSEKREENFELKFLRKELSKVDDKIVMPDSLRGDALRRKLDAVQPPEPAAPDKKSGIVFGLKWFSLQSGLTYAAAFALIVGLFYGLGLHQQPDMVDGSMALPEQQRIQADAGEFDILMETYDLEMAYDDDAPMNVTTGGGDGAVSDQPQGAAPRESGGRPATGRSNPTTGGGGSGSGVGGGSESAVLGSQNGYSYTYRSNDSSDPDKGNYPISVEIIDDSATQPVAVIDIPDIQSIETVHFSGDTLSIVGATSGSVVTRTYNIQSPEQPVELVVLEQPGSYVSSRMKGDVVHTVTYSEEAPVSSGIPTETLPGAVSDSACVVSAVDTSSQAVNAVAFVGADENVALFDMGAYITYEGEVEPEETAPQEETPPQPVDDALPENDEAAVDAAEDAPADTAADLESPQSDPTGEDELDTTKYYAQIVLNGTDISLGSVTP